MGITRELIETELRKHRTLAKASVANGYARDAFAQWLRRNKQLHEVRGDSASVLAPPEDVRTVDEIKEAKRQVFAHKRNHAKAAELIPVEIKDDGPIGIAHFGDPHLDDNGCDVDQIDHHTSIVRETDGLYAASVGDYTNNWVGRLARVYAEQTTSAKEGWKLVESFIQSCPWLYLVAGNHDAWSGANDPLSYIAAAAKTYLAYHGARLALQFPNGREVRINCRHDFKGVSQYDEAFGPGKAFLWGFRDHIFTCGHRHTNGYKRMARYLYNGEPIIAHCIRVAAYKKFDDFAASKNFLPTPNQPCVVTIIDPHTDNPHELVKVRWDIQDAAEELKWRRAKAA
jgi:hypothetical protein